LRAGELLREIAEAAAREIERLESEFGATLSSEIPRDATKAYKRAYSIIDQLSVELLVASGAFQDPQPDERPPELSSREKPRFLHEMRSVMGAVARAGLPKAVHRIIETIAFLAPSDPRAGIEAFAHTLDLARGADYESQQTGASKALRFLSTFLEQHLDVLLADEQSRRHFVSIVERFAAAGWCEAHELVYGLERLYR
jgi:hypothetical protein